MDWSKFFFFTWLAEEEELDELRRENAALRQQLEQRQWEDDTAFDDCGDDGYDDQDYRDPQDG